MEGNTASSNDAYRVSLLEAALEIVASAIFVFNEAGNLTFANQVARDLSLARHEEAGLMKVVDDVKLVALDGSFQELEFSLYGPPKRDYIIRTSAPFESRDGGVIVTIEDLTTRNQLDIIRRDFVANVSHELRTPIGALGLLAETLAFEDDAAVRHRLANRIQNEAFRVAKIIDDLLDLSKFESEGSKNEDELSIVDLALDVIDHITPTAENASVKLTLEAEDGEFSLIGDPIQLRSALTNLIDNSIKYSEADSEVIVAVFDDGDEMVISVTDHGIGIPQKDLDRIFERFYRVDQARSRQTGGTGLGLSIVRHAVSNHGGTIEVESREGIGSTFKIKLPRNRKGNRK